jgi:hypothetical protein
MLEGEPTQQGRCIIVMASAFPLLPAGIFWFIKHFVDFLLEAEVYLILKAFGHDLRLLSPPRSSARDRHQTPNDLPDGINTVPADRCVHNVQRLKLARPLRPDRFKSCLLLVAQASVEVIERRTH